MGYIKWLWWRIRNGSGWRRDMAWNKGRTEFTSCSYSFSLFCDSTISKLIFKGERLVGAISVIKARAPVTGGNFGVWGGMFSTFDCAVKGWRQKEDAWNAIISGFLTGGCLAARSMSRSDISSWIWCADLPCYRWPKRGSRWCSSLWYSARGFWRRWCHFWSNIFRRN